MFVFKYVVYYYFLLLKKVVPFDETILQKSHLCASVAQTSTEDPQQKLSQMLQIAQFQAYLASAASSVNKTENEAAREELQ